MESEMQVIAVVAPFPSWLSEQGWNFFLQSQLFEVRDEFTDRGSSVVGTVCKLGTQSYSPFIVAGMRCQTDITDFVLTLFILQNNAS